MAQGSLRSSALLLKHHTSKLTHPFRQCKNSLFVLNALCSRSDRGDRFFVPRFRRLLESPTTAVIYQGLWGHDPSPSGANKTLFDTVDRVVIDEVTSFCFFY